MAVEGNIHSRLVFWLKITLPLLALALLSTLFLVSRQIDTDDALPYARVDVQALARDPRLTAPEFSAVTSDGASISFSAATARPETGQSAHAEADALVAAYDTPDGLRIDLSASQGRIDTVAGLMTLTGDVTIVTSSGYKIETARLDTALDRTNLSSDGAVTVDAPYGKIVAGHMQLSHEDAEIPGYVLVFNNGVKLVYEPET
ncbi:MAG: LPS export ABC transporter periplasmic protein LptC [Albidovulum sp.]